MAWYKIVWFPKAIKRHAFILWLIILNRINTKDKRGIISNSSCVFCNAHIETCEHLFITCPIAVKVWKAILEKCCVFRRPRLWQNELIWATHNLKGNSFGNTIKRIAWAATFYYIWRQRNIRIHENVFRLANFVISYVVDDVRFCIASLKNFIDNARTRIFCTNWGINYDILS